MDSKRHSVDRKCSEQTWRQSRVESFQTQQSSNLTLCPSLTSLLADVSNTLAPRCITATFIVSLHSTLDQVNRENYWPWQNTSSASCDQAGHHCTKSSSRIGHTIYSLHQVVPNHIVDNEVDNTGGNITDHHNIERTITAAQSTGWVHLTNAVHWTS